MPVLYATPVVSAEGPDMLMPFPVLYAAPVVNAEGLDMLVPFVML